MSIKYSIQGLLIYAAMAGYLAAFIVSLLRRCRIAEVFFVLGFVFSVVSFAYRWITVGHVPMKNLFEVFLAMGSAVYLISLLSVWLLDVHQKSVDMLIGAVVLFPAGFVFSAQPRPLPPALQSPFFIPHVAAYVLAYIFMFKAAIEAVRTFGARRSEAKDLAIRTEQSTYSLVCCGLPLLTLGLVLGSVWAHYAWADFWGFDPKELWSLATWLVYVGYMHFRFMHKAKYRRINSLWVLTGLLFVGITLFWANLSRLFSGLHSYAM